MTEEQIKSVSSCDISPVRGHLADSESASVSGIGPDPSPSLQVGKKNDEDSKIIAASEEQYVLVSVKPDVDIELYSTGPATSESMPDVTPKPSMETHDQAPQNALMPPPPTPMSQMLLHPGLFGVPPPSPGEVPYHQPPAPDESAQGGQAPTAPSQGPMPPPQGKQYLTDPWTSPLVASCLALWDHNMWMRQFQQQLGSLLSLQLQLQPHLYDPRINQNAAPGLHMPQMRTYHNWKANQNAEAIMSCRDTVTDRLSRSDVTKDRDKNANAFGLPPSLVPIFNVQCTSSQSVPTQTSNHTIFTSPTQNAVIVPSDCGKQGLSYHEVIQTSGDRPLSSLSVDSGIDISRMSSISPSQDLREKVHSTPPPITPLAMKATPPPWLLHQEHGPVPTMPPMEEGSEGGSECGESLLSEMELPPDSSTCSIQTALYSEAEDSLLTEDSHAELYSRLDEQVSVISFTCEHVTCMHY